MARAKQQWRLYENKTIRPVWMRSSLVLACSAYGTTINVNSRINGDFASGFPAVEVSVSEGTWLVTPTNPLLDNDALFTAWSQFASAPFWNSALAIREKNSGITHFMGTFSGIPTSPDLAFADPANVPYSFTLSGPEILQFFVQDNLLFDNRGGISVRLDQVASVPDASSTTPGLLLALTTGILLCIKARRQDW